MCTKKPIACAAGYRIIIQIYIEIEAYVNLDFLTNNSAHPCERKSERLVLLAILIPILKMNSMSTLSLSHFYAFTIDDLTQE